MSQSKNTYDVAIVGAGFAGSLLASIARRIGLDVVLLERGRHPRFAIGESSTPLGNLQLELLAAEYGLAWLRPLCKYGSWQRTHPEIGCGLKRGFSFFHHRTGHHFEPSDTHANELLVAANPNAERGDTHWYRSDVDSFLVRQAIAEGACYVDRCELSTISRDDCWRLRGQCEAGPVDLAASFLVDATGPEGRVARSLGFSPTHEGIRTTTRALYGHFTGVAPWQEVLAERGACQEDHPFPCDASALHHVLDGGWMWVLRFDNGITSAGFSLDPRRFPKEEKVTPQAEWDRLMAAYPSVRRQFARAQPLRPLESTGRLQRRLPVAAGDGWAALPHAACYLDPWLSPGIAHSLFGVARVARLLQLPPGGADRAKRLAAYSSSVLAEAEILDRIDAACFACLYRFPVLASTSMLYFAAAIFQEERIRAGRAGTDEAFLLADDAGFAAAVAEVCEAAPRVRMEEADDYTRWVAGKIAPFNRVGLCDPRRRNMYPYDPWQDGKSA